MLLALEAFTPYQLICLDIMMPGMDGQSALQTTRGLENARGILSCDWAKIVMTTSLGDSQSVFSAFRSVCDGYLTKPIDRLPR